MPCDVSPSKRRHPFPQQRNHDNADNQYVGRAQSEHATYSTAHDKARHEGGPDSLGRASFGRSHPLNKQDRDTIQPQAANRILAANLCSLAGNQQAVRTRPVPPEPNPSRPWRLRKRHSQTPACRPKTCTWRSIARGGSPNTRRDTRRRASACGESPWSLCRKANPWPKLNTCT